MKDYQFKLNNKVDEKYQPKELEALEIKASFDNLSYQPDITATEITLINEAAQEINNYIDGAINNTTRGIFEGLPYEILLMSEQPPYNAFKGYLDLLNIKRKCDEVLVKLVSENDITKFSEKAQAITYGYLEDTAGLNLFPKTKLTSVPYCVNYIPDNIQLLMVSVSVYLISKELYDTVPKIPEHIAAVVLAATPCVGLGVVVDVGNIVIQSIKLALLIAYTVLIVIALIQLIEQLFNEIYSIKRWYRACKIKTLLEVGCNYLGYQFSSSIFNSAPYNNLVFIPQKTKKGTVVENDSHSSLFGKTIIDDTGVPNSLGYGYTIYEMFQLIMNMFNAKLLVKNGTVYIEPKANKSFWKKNSTYILPDIEVLTKEYNTDELNPNYIIKFTYDAVDKNTIDNFKGTNYERITSPISIDNKKYLNFGGLKEIDLKVGLAKRKTELSTIEKLLEGLATVTDKIISFLGGNSNFINSFIDRIGIMEVSEHAGWSPKVVLIENKKIPVNNSTYLSAKYLYDNYHYIDSFVANNYSGQYELYKDVIIPFCYHDFLKTIENGYFVTVNGIEGKFDEIVWNFTQNYAKVSYRLQKPYTKNLKEIFIEAE